MSVRACNVCTTPHSMGGYIYCTVAVQFAGSHSPPLQDSHLEQLAHLGYELEAR